MHKKIKAELVHLANSILQMENNEDVLEMHKKAQDIYEKLTVLKFVNESLYPSFNEKKLKDEEKRNDFFKDKIEFAVEETEMDVEIHQEVEKTAIEIPAVEEEIHIEFGVNNDNEAIEEDTIMPIQKSETIEEVIEEVIEEEVEVSIQFDNEPEEIVVEKEVVNVTEAPIKLLFEDEFKDAVSADVATNMFEKVTKENPIIEKTAEVEVKKKSLNDALFSANIQVGLNDRIAFVKYLFDGSQEDFNRVLSQLNSFKEYNEAIHFINDFVKPDYNWAGKEEYEERLKSLIERKFS